MEEEFDFLGVDKFSLGFSGRPIHQGDSHVGDIVMLVT